MSKIAIIGAGMAGLTAASLLRDNAEITLFEKSPKPGGRMATRDNAPYTFDHGAQYFKVRSPQFKSFIQPLIDNGVIARWDARFAEIVKDEIHFSSQWSEEYPHYVGVPGMNAIGKALASDLSVHYNCQIESLHRVNKHWLVEDAGNQISEEFDWIICTLPAVQTTQLLTDSVAFAKQINTHSMKACYSLMLGFEQDLALPFDAALVRGHDISWVSVNSSKPGRSSYFSLLLHSTNDWADKHINDNNDFVMNHLLEQGNAVLQTNLHAAQHTSIHRWRYANAEKTTGEEFMLDKNLHIAVCGDWMIHGRVEAAFVSAYQLAHKIKKEL